MTNTSANERRNIQEDVAKIPRRRSICGPCELRHLITAQHQCAVRRRCSLPIEKKSVQFSEMSEVRVVEVHPEAKWYSLEDHERFKQERIHDLLSFRDHARAKTKSVLHTCPVGLEQLLSSKGIRDAKTNRKLTIRIVLLEQNRQRASGVNDPDQLATLSLTQSADALVGARKRAKFQEMAKCV